ncbi:transketolase [compost metagenome]
MAERWRSFGWETYEIDGHNLAEIRDVLSIEQTKPKAVIAHSIKGKGVSFMENKLEWHYKSPNGDELKIAYDELGDFL